MSPFRYLLIAGSFLYGAGCIAQQDSLATDTTTSERIINLNTDSLDWRARHKPARATLYSALLPGAGQIYNRKYWKAPIAWGGLGLCVYFIQENSKQYVRYRDGYVAMIDADPSTVSEFEGGNAASVREVADTYRKWRDQSYLALAGVYILNVLDASVDAHFVRFDVGEDLSLRWAPSPLIAGQAGMGLSFTLALR